MRSISFLLAAALLAGTGCSTLTYQNVYISPNAPKAAYPKVTIRTDGYFADQVALALKKKMPGKPYSEAGGDIQLLISSRIELLARKEGFFKVNARPAVTTLTVQAVRSTDMEIVYSLVKQFQVIIDQKQGAVTEGWVDQAAAALANDLQTNLFVN